MLLLAAVLLAYLFAVSVQRHDWRYLRTASFIGGVLLVAVALSSPVAAFAHADLRGHMLQHLLLGMFAPLALVLGAPGTLLLRTVPVAFARGIVRALSLRGVRWLIHPITAALLDIGGMYVLYLTPLYAISLASPLVHVLVHVHFIVSGYLFTWSIAGPDPAPHRPALITRLIVLFLATAAHATLGKLMYAYEFPRHTAHSVDEIQSAAQVMYYGGDIAELLLAVAFFSLWFRSARRTGRTFNPRYGKSFSYGMSR